MLHLLSVLQLESSHFPTAMFSQEMNISTSLELPGQIVLPLGDPESASHHEEGLFRRFEFSFYSKPSFGYFSIDGQAPLIDELPNLHVYLPFSSSRPAEPHSLQSRLPPQRLKRFVNKDVVLYIRRPSDRMRDDCLMRDLFKAWYPLRPPAPTHTSTSTATIAEDETTLALSGSSTLSAIPILPSTVAMPTPQPADSETSNLPKVSSAGEPTQQTSKDLPTVFQAYTVLEHGFCVPMVAIPPKENGGNIDLVELVNAHVALVSGIRAVLDEINMEPPGMWQTGWSRGLVRLGGGLGNGFCIHDGPYLIGEERYPREKRDTRARRKLRVVGREAWVRRGWGGTEIEVPLDLWEEIEGAKGLKEATEEEGEAENDGRWLTRVMGMQEAVEGVIRASGEQGRFEPKPVSMYFQNEFVDPPRKSEDEVKEINERLADFKRRLDLQSQQASEEELAAKKAGTFSATR